MKIKYFSDDGKEHSTEEACKKYEAQNTIEARIIHALSGGGPKALETLQAAMSYKEYARDLADALEQVARKCAQARIEQGGAKRIRKGKTDGAPPVGETKPEERKPVDTTGIRAIHERAARDGDTQKYPTEANPFPAHGRPGQVPSEGAPSPAAAE